VPAAGVSRRSLLSRSAAGGLGLVLSGSLPGLFGTGVAVARLGDAGAEEARQAARQHEAQAAGGRAAQQRAARYSGGRHGVGSVRAQVRRRHAKAPEVVNTARTIASGLPARVTTA
jgi:hypothetical protein